MPVISYLGDPIDIYRTIPGDLSLPFPTVVISDPNSDPLIVSVTIGTYDPAAFHQLLEVHFVAVPTGTPVQTAERLLGNTADWPHRIRQSVRGVRNEGLFLRWNDLPSGQWSIRSVFVAGSE